MAGTVESGDGVAFGRLSPESVINLQFADLQYSVAASVKSSKTILNGVNGEFRGGELTAIMGPSGCGKTTLLNILAGYRIYKTSGQISIDGKPLKRNKFRKISRYVLQDDHINPFFTVWETLMFASHFKLNSRYYTKEKRHTEIKKILEIFNLRDHAHTMTSDLSGGQQKRVCIAVELLDQPAVLFLDEPTTGLDEYSAAQCVTQLKCLAQSGRTLVCSIHGPSARLLAMFDKVYVMAEGQCVYQGPVNHIVTFLERLNLNCPLTYNPADFIVEVASYAYGDYNAEMVQAIRNGRIYQWLPDGNECEIKQSFGIQSPATTKREDVYKITKSIEYGQSSWWSEFKWIFLRNMKHSIRDKANLKLRVVVHIILAAICGYAYLGVGDNGVLGLFNYHFSLITSVLCIFMSMTPMIAYVPQEMLYLRREHFNQWYSLSSYFLALLAAQLPIITVMSVISSALLYTLAEQPMELLRYFSYLGIIQLTTMMGSSYGLLVGSRFSLLNALFIGPSIMSVFAILACHAVETTQMPLFDSIVMYSSCVRHALEGFLAALLKNNRSDITCPSNEMFCIMSKPDFILKVAGSRNVDYVRSVLCLMGFYTLYATLAFVNLKSRLSTSDYLQNSPQYRYIKYVIRKYLYVQMF